MIDSYQSFQQYRFLLIVKGHLNFLHIFFCGKFKLNITIIAEIAKMSRAKSKDKHKTINNKREMTDAALEALVSCSQTVDR